MTIFFSAENWSSFYVWIGKYGYLFNFNYDANCLRNNMQNLEKLSSIYCFYKNNHLNLSLQMQTIIFINEEESRKLRAVIYEINMFVCCFFQYLNDHKEQIITILSYSKLFTHTRLSDRSWMVYCIPKRSLWKNERSEAGTFNVAHTTAKHEYPCASSETKQ